MIVNGLCLQKENLIKNRKYHLRTYKSCIVGKELLDWLIRNKHFDTRESAIKCLNLLLKCSLLHHVCDDHGVKDEFLFYRFRRDDDTYKQIPDLSLFYKALELNKEISVRNGGIMRNFQQGGELFTNAFKGDSFTDFLLREGHVYTREEAVQMGRRLLESDIIRHVTDDFHFRDDDHLLYQFTIDFQRPRIYSDLLHFVSRDHELTEKGRKQHAGHSDQEFFTPNSTPVNTPEIARKKANNHDSPPTPIKPAPRRGKADEHRDEFVDRDRSLSADSGNSTDTSETSTENCRTKSVLLRQATVHELESPNTPYVKHSIKINSDPVGYGFVIRGDSPTYVQAVDPMGPAAIAGLKVRQYIYSVNGQYVLKKDHKQVGRLIMESPSHVNLVVMLHKRDAQWS